MIEVQINDRQYNGWSRIACTQSLTHIDATFSATIANTAIQVSRGARYRVLVNGVLAQTGVIRSISATLSGQVQVSGAPLVRDAARAKINIAYENISLSKLATELLEPYNISVDYRAESDPTIAQIAVHSSSPLAVLDKYLTDNGLLATIAPDGGLVITHTQAEPAAATLTQGENVIHAQYSSNEDAEHSHYIVHSHADDIQVSGQSINPRVSTYCPFHHIVTESLTSEQCAIRARWLQNVRAGNSEKLQITTAGWLHGESAIWQIHTLVGVELPRLGVSGRYLLHAVSLNMDASGQRATLQLSSPEAYTPQPIAQTPASAQVANGQHWSDDFNQTLQEP